MSAFRGLLAVGYLAGTLALGFVLWFSGVYGHGEIGGRGSRSAWHQDVDAWQWDVIYGLGIAGLAVGLVTLVRGSIAPLALHAVLSGVGVALVLDADVVNRGQLALGWFATFGAGASFVYARRR